MRREMLVELVFGDEGLRTAWALERLITRVRVDMPHQLVCRRKRAFIAALPLTDKATRTTDMMRTDMVIQRLCIAKLLVACCSID
jgi:hypothetical protein